MNYATRWQVLEYLKKGIKKMNSELAKTILEKAINCDIKLQYDQEHFGVVEIELKKNNFTVTDELLETENMLIPFKNIITLEIIADEFTRITLIENADSLQEAIHYTSEYITDDEKVALEILQLKLFETTKKEVLRELEIEISEIINSNGYNSSVESVLINLLLNILKKEKIETSKDLSVLRLVKENEIKKIIEEMESIF